MPIRKKRKMPAEAAPAMLDRGGAGAASPAGPCGEGGMAEVVASLSENLESLVAHCARLETVNKVQEEYWKARDNIRLHCVHLADDSRRRWEEACMELVQGDKVLEARCAKKLAELKESDLEDSSYRETLLEVENDELKIKLKEVRSSPNLNQSIDAVDHEGIARGLRAELRKLNQAFDTLGSNKCNEVSALLTERGLLRDQLRTMEQSYDALLEERKMEAAQAVEAAQQFKQNVEELQVAAQDKDNEIGRLRAEAADSRKKLHEMYSLVKEKVDGNGKCCAEKDLACSQLRTVDLSYTSPENMKQAYEKSKKELQHSLEVLEESVDSLRTWRWDVPKFW